MENDKGKKGRENRPGEGEQTQTTPQREGVLAIHVYDSTAAAQRGPVRGARVTLWNAAGLQMPPDVTDASGNLIKRVPEGQWKVVTEAFGQTDTQTEIEVRPKCETDVDVFLGINPSIRISASGGDTPRFYPSGAIVSAEFQPSKTLQNVDYQWTRSGGTIVYGGESQTGDQIFIDTSGLRTKLDIGIRVIGRDGGESISQMTTVPIVGPAVVPVTGALNVALRRSATTITQDLPLWVVIRNSTEGLSFKNYQRYIDMVLCNPQPDDAPTNTLTRQFGTRNEEFRRLRKHRFLPFTDTDAYRLLKVATEAFVMVNCGIALKNYPFDQPDVDILTSRTGLENLPLGDFEKLWTDYLVDVNGIEDLTIPYLALIASKVPDARLKSEAVASFYARARDIAVDPCYDTLTQKLSEPCLVELIWSYWHEEAMLVQTINAISLRFQNRRARAGDPLANMEISALRPLNNLLWGYVQDEQHRLTVMRRGNEYMHGYGLPLQGKAVRYMRIAENRSQFLQAFHNLLHVSSVFFQKDDNTQVLSDAFPVLNALKEVHLILSQGAHNQFGDLPATARIEMLMQQWLLARPEFQEFLPTRAMVAYPEPWMDRVDAMKRLQGWSDVNVLHFRDLGVFGEKLLLTIRYGSWVDVNDPDQAKNWARAWRPEIQGYIHAYRAVTGVDVSSEPVNSTLPSVLLQQRLAQQPRHRLC
jgi:hypothetical protein